MKRYVDLGEQLTGYKFAWWDTVSDIFESHSGSMAWDTFNEFAMDYEGDDLERYLSLMPRDKEQNDGGK